MLILLLACAPTADTGGKPAADAPPWDADCPGADRFVGEEGWGGRLVVEPGVACSLPKEGRTLPDELAAKAWFKLAAGEYPVPTEAGDGQIEFPACVRSGASPTLAGAGPTAVRIEEYGSTAYTYVEGSQPMEGGWTLAHTLILVGDVGTTPAPLEFNAGAADLSTGAIATFSLYADGTQPTDLPTQTFVPCDAETWAHDTHRITFDGGEIELNLALDFSNMVTAPSQLLQARGTLDGTTFDVVDYFRLVYAPGHHHVTRAFAVVFDAPIGEACALVVESVDAQPASVTAKVRTADCALSPIAERSVQGDTWTSE